MIRVKPHAPYFYLRGRSVRCASLSPRARNQLDSPKPALARSLRKNALSDLRSPESGEEGKNGSGLTPLMTGPAPFV
jgi:hypothetical protein